jgi:hypothetical protein
VSLALALAFCPCALALNPALDVSQYAHTAWKVRDGFSKGNIYSIAQTQDGYLWLGTDFGLLRFDGVRTIPWQSTKVLPEMDVVKRLSELCPRYPVESVACLRLIIEGDTDGWILLGIENDARALLSQALAGNHPDGALSAKRLVEELIAKGQFSFRTLLG